MTDARPTGPTKGPILLHVGTPKTGTSYLQDVLFRNRDRLAAQGLLYPAERFDGQFLAALDLMRLPWGGLEKQAVGAWAELAEKARAWEGTVIISHEILATAQRGDIRRALESLGHPEREVRVVLSVRDLVRQIPAEWQENVKHRRTLRYSKFLDQIQHPDRPGKVAPWFWGAQDVPDILSRWAADIDPSLVTLVTVPPSGAPRDLLWERFVEAFGLDRYRYDLHTERANPSMGVPETALMRRINRRANAVVPPADYRPLVRELLGHQTLALRSGSPRLSVPPHVWSWADELATTWITELRSRGYGVVGSFDDLSPAPLTAEYADPDHPKERQVASAAVEAITALLVEGARQREVEAQLRLELAAANAALDSSRGFKQRVKGRVYRYAAGRKWGRKAIERHKQRRSPRI
ncbi:hypothetical protein [Nocardioides cavernaquae]|uniref:Sulfotransferase family protein n=1 Tax=Nocardioides cavernaquae TaxID=2321396 RepID=A0A3A5H7L6_9ACTN|nr:hypothetical protein [Nocardioides cavernaquae]RJS45858.1 hypothetical protein D4739_06205 [Nocardioides cavernaquae]